MNTEVNTGWRSLLTQGLIYRAVQYVFSEKRSKQLLLDQYIEPAGSGCIVLDMGCGPGNLLRFLPGEVRYVGYDISREYIESARGKYAGRDNAEFFCASSLDEKLVNALPDAGVDVAIIHGVIHHISDDQALDMLELARRKVRPGGVVVALEPVWFDGQSPFRRWVMSLDRGKNIKTLVAWQRFFDVSAKEWANVQVEVHPNLIRFYDLVVCTLTLK